LQSSIQRLVVEGGFLDGLDLSFSEGLNVIIGGRGTGKTSIIELIRYCLDVKNYTEVSQLRSREHALAVLGDGQVTLHLNDRGTSVSIARSSRDSGKSPRLRTNPSIFSQTDIETIGLSSKGRLKLIDDFIDRTSREEDANIFSAQVSSLTHELRELINERGSLESQVSQLAELREKLVDLERQQQENSQNSTQLEEKNSELRELSVLSNALQVQAVTYAKAIDSLSGLATRIEALLRAFPNLNLSGHESISTEKEPALALENEASKARRALEQAKEHLSRAVKIAGGSKSGVTNSLEPLDTKARELRKQIELIQAGAGALARSIAVVKSQIAELTTIEFLREQKSAQVHDLQIERRRSLDALEGLRLERYSLREKVGRTLNASLGPRIRVGCAHLANYEAYISQITQALRGSGLRYSELSQQIAEKMSPRELGEAVEMGDYPALSALRISPDRLARLVDALQEFGTEGLLTCDVEDEITLQLLDGTTYKNIDALSTGQRCTVLLPIVLQHRERTLIVDQPEDHLDNAFVVETLVKSILNRSGIAQTIFATHNANIPVLGDSSKVIVMGSDGKRAFVERAGSLHDPEIVEAITNVMEGGRKAFRRRALFYGGL
jgi:hypothetical protein